MENDIDTLNILRLILITILLGFLFWIVLKSMYQPELFKAIDTKHQLVKTIVKDNTNKKDDTTSTIATQIKELQNFMDEKEPFFDPTLTLHKLANQVKLHSS